MIALAVMVAGALGAVTRFVVDGAVRHRWPTTTPWGTFAINVSGSALLGVLAGVVVFHGAPHEWQLIAGTGFCGGYTTFSTASFETVRLVQRNDRWRAGAYAIGTLVASVTACAVGMWVARLV
ncbi:fluoride efflux transporter CrcB [Gordonia McavH-238-E]|uniref:fluoride efflux transporter CrcB n=1 Tax=Gordonia sp. McavH-238-E TaxID=2917736 RepID=UPI001EF661C0|nr:fluoride efflux transporter CrcB [Gordonia sp. McavH-238-E]MCG7633893.1 fluoride efflux transporter CrcB [Gordonia sp. McavH-238-E]